MAQLLLLRQLNLNKSLIHWTPLLLPQKHCRHFGLSQILNQKQQEGLAPSNNSTRTDVSTDVRPLGEKIKENTKTASYTAIILAGIGVTGIMFYAIFRELFSGASPNSIYSHALDLVKEDTRVQDAIGAPIKGFGEESRRGRRQHVAHSNFERNGVPHMRMQFYVQGLRNKATVHLESRATPSGKQEFRYLFVQLNHCPHTTIILEDNRAFDPQPLTSSPIMHSTSFAASALDMSSFTKK